MRTFAKVLLLLAILILLPMSFVLQTLSMRAFSPGFYKSVFERADLYNMMVAVAVDETLQKSAWEKIGVGGAARAKLRADLVRVGRKEIADGFLRSNVERLVSETCDWFRGDDSFGSFNPTLDLRPLKERAFPAMREQAKRTLAELPVCGSGGPGADASGQTACLPALTKRTLPLLLDPLTGGLTRGLPETMQLSMFLGPRADLVGREFEELRTLRRTLLWANWLCLAVLLGLLLGLFLLTRDRLRSALRWLATAVLFPCLLLGLFAGLIYFAVAFVETWAPVAKTPGVALEFVQRTWTALVVQVFWPIGGLLVISLVGYVVSFFVPEGEQNRSTQTGGVA